MMLEPAVTVTDLLLFLLNMAFVARLLAALPSPRRTHFVIFFAAIGISALAGALAHGFFPEPTFTGLVLWRITMLSLGVTSVAAFLVATDLFMPDRPGPYAAIAAVPLTAYANIVLFVRSDFPVALTFYVPSAVLMLVGFLSVSTRLPRAGWLGALGLVLTLVSAYIQHARIGRHAVWFDHNATYHVVQGVGLLLIFIAAKELIAIHDPCTDCDA